ncbi:hypothetical protein ABID56_001025 [Alkalibacillus flavidus]|uniref:Uncharacterized protein n=1 Tax=Alkalibacillus flavidus TaxID=546021 RepID=A0ABV2KW62_9BACI
MVTYKMKWKERYKDSGFVKELTDYNTESGKGVYSSYMEPSEGQKKAGSKGEATFKLEREKWYVIQDTDEEKIKYYYITSNDKPKSVTFPDAKKHFINKNKRQTQKEQTDNVLSMTNDNSSYKKNEIDSDIEFMIDQFQFILENRNTDQNFIRGVLYTIQHFADTKNMQNEFETIKNLFEEEKSANDIKAYFSNEESNSNKWLFDSLLESLNSKTG